jgi:probable O-glycosylation ligase (exosortase A-associated)
MFLKVVFMVLVTFGGTVGSVVYTPFIGVFVYYFYGVLRPQFIWEYALPVFAWSFYPSIASMASVIAWRLGMWDLSSGVGPQDPIPNLNVGHRAMFFFGFWVTLSFIFAKHHYQAAEDVYVEYVKIFTMFYIAGRAITRINEIWWLFLMIALVLGYIAVEINHIYIANNQYPLLFKRGYAGLDNNGAALMLAMGIPICLSAWDGIRHWSRWGFLLFIPAIIHAVLTSYSRGAMLSALVVIPIYLLRFQRKMQLLALLGTIVFAMPFMAGKEIQERFITVKESETDESANSRLVSWGIAWRMACEEPLFGFGIRNSNLYTYAYGADIEGRTIHSQWLQIAADSGLVGAGAYIFTMLSAFWCLYQVRKIVRNHQDLEARRIRTIAVGCESSLLLFCFGGSFLSLENFELPYLLQLLSAQLWAVCQVRRPSAVDQRDLQSASKVASVFHR